MSNYGSINPTSNPLPVFDSLDDSPMFRQTVEALEASVGRLEKRTARLVKGGHKYGDSINALGEQQLAFAECIQEFAGDNEEESTLLGGMALQRFANVLKEVASGSGMLGVQMDRLCEPLQETWIKGVLKNVHESRKKWDKKAAEYDAAARRHLQPGHSVVKSNVSKWIREDPKKAMAEAEAAQLAADTARFELASQISVVEGKKRYAFLNALTGTMEAHLAFFERGAQIMRDLQPFLEEVKGAVARYEAEDVALQKMLKEAKETYNIARAERAERLAATPQAAPPSATGGPLQMTSQVSSLASDFEALRAMTLSTTASGMPPALKQGYLLKRSSNAYRDWKRRYFVLSPTGLLTYFSSKEKGGEKVQQNTVSLLTATVKADSDDPALRFCFRVISPEKTYTLQADNELDRQEWISAIQGVIACLLNGAIDTPQLPPGAAARASLPARGRHSRHNSAAELYGYGFDTPLAAERVMSDLRADGTPRSPSVPPAASGNSMFETMPGTASRMRAGATPHGTPTRGPDVMERLRRVAGNNVCCDCGSPDPDWASLNLAVLLCIECSGIHRQLGVHVSKVRSLTLDVRVWEEGGVMDMMSKLGNEAGNEVWEEALRHIHQRADSWVWTDDSEDERSPGVSTPSPSPFRLASATSRQGSGAMAPSVSDSVIPYAKPNARHGLGVKEQYIRAKYVERRFVAPARGLADSPQVDLWSAAVAGDVKGVMRAHVRGASIKHAYTGPAAAQMVAEAEARVRRPGAAAVAPPAAGSNAPAGLTVLHVACQGGPSGLREYLLQNGAEHSARDERGRTPLHYAVLYDCVDAAKMLIVRGADREARDTSGATPLEAAMCKGGIPDDDLFMMLSSDGR